MKRLIKLSLALLSTCSIAPILFISSTSCSSINFSKALTLDSKYTGSNSDIFNDDINFNYGSQKKSSTSIKNLYYGDKDICSGNYIMLVGSTATAEVATTGFATENNSTNQALLKFLFGHDSSFWNGQTWQSSLGNNFNSNAIHYTTNNSDNSGLLDGLASFHKSLPNIDTVPFKMFSYIDVAPITIYGDDCVYNNTKLYKDINISPFYKWTSDKSGTSDFYNKYLDKDYTSKATTKKDKWQKAHKETKYARNDKSAKQYRDIVDRMSTLDNSLVSGSMDKGVILGWKDGVPQKPCTDLTSDSFSAWLQGLYSK